MTFFSTAAVYDEVRNELERPDRIRREAFKLLDRGELHRLPELKDRLRFTVDREKNGLHSSIAFDIEQPEYRSGAKPTIIAELREACLVRLIEILESDVD